MTEDVPTVVVPVQAGEGQTKPTHRRRSRRIIAWLVGLGLILGAVTFTLLVAANMWVLHDGAPRYDTVDEVPARPVAIVFGAGIDGDQPSLALKDRLDAAVALYEAGTVPKLLVTGDNHVTTYDEVSVMRTYLINHGVPADVITRDYAGFDTFDSCARARTIFGVDAAVLVTQDYHLARALFTCKKLGIDAVGLAVPDWQHLPDRAGFSWPMSMRRGYTVREWVARAKAVAQTEILEPSPKLGGPAVGLVPN